nr:MAG TPA: hypothetical protein [Caudoviricetes sp.]
MLARRTDGGALPGRSTGGRNPKARGLVLGEADQAAAASHLLHSILHG